MTCEEALVLISGRLDGENTPEEAAALEAHLQHCGVCRQLARELEQLQSGLAELEAPPENLRQSVMETIRAEALGVKKHRRFRWAGLAAAAALALVIGVGTLGLPGTAQPTAVQEQPAVARVAAPAEQALEEYAVSVQTEDAGIFYQQLADDRHADVAVLRESVPELEGCPSELLPDGSVLYTLAQADGAVQLSRQYGAELYQPAGEGAHSCSYALVPGG